MSRPNESGVELQRALIVHDQTPQVDVSLSPKQQKFIADRALSYLRNIRAEFNPSNYQRALAVLGVDSLMRGLLIANKQSLKPNESIRSLVENGLKHREEMKTIIDGVIAESTDLRGLNRSLYGPYALPREWLVHAQLILPNYQLVPDLAEFDRIAQLSETRKFMLVGLTAGVLSALPAGRYPEASLDMFPSNYDRARLVRNYLSRSTFDDAPLPVLSIEELRDFVYQEESVLDRQIRLSPRILHTIAPILQNMSFVGRAVQERYLEDLLAQVREATLNIKNELVGELLPSSIDTRDRIYKRLSPTLLLLHPALEEREFITNINRASESPYSLWGGEHSILVGDYRLPTIDGLLRAVRLAQAKGYEPKRFKEAIAGWHKFEKERSREALRLISLSEELVLLEAKITGLKDGSESVPEQIANLALERHAVLKDRLKGRTFAFNNHQRIINSANLTMSRLSGHLQALRERNNGQLPDTSEIPEWVLAEKQTKETRLKNLRKQAALRKTNNALALLQEDFFQGISLKSLLRIDDWEGKSQDNIKVEIEHLNDLYSLLIRGHDFVKIVGGGKITFDQVHDYIRSYRQVVRSRLFGNSTGYSGDTRRRLELRRLDDVMVQADANSDDKKQEALEEFYAFVIKNRIYNLKYLLGAREVLDDIAGQGDIDKNWSREDLLDWQQSVSVSCFAVQSYSGTELADHWNNLKEVYREISLFRTGHSTINWPRYLPNRSNISEWIDDTVRELEDVKKLRLQGEINETVERQNEINDNKVDLLLKIKSALGQPFLPIEEGAGLLTLDFWKYFESRMRLLQAIVKFDQARRNYEIVQSDYRAFSKYFYLDMLNSKITDSKEQILRLEGKPAHTRFISLMHRLDLALKTA